MAARASWKGYINLSLVSVAVKGYTATSSTDTISLNQLHDECHSRINYKKSCPIHGEVPNDEIVKGYKYAKDQYAIIDTEELEKLRTQADRSIRIDKFVSADEIEPIYFSGKTYYLTPEGPVHQKGYALLHSILAEENLLGLAQVVISSRERLVALRPLDNLLAVSVLHYPEYITDPTTFESELTERELTKQELDLARTLVQATTESTPDLASYIDLYNKRLTQLIESKVEGEELVQVTEQEGPAVINLMEALKQSLKTVEPSKAKPKRAAAKKKMATSTKKKAPAPRKKKSG